MNFIFAKFELKFKYLLKALFAAPGTAFECDGESCTRWQAIKYGWQKIDQLFNGETI